MNEIRDGEVGRKQLESRKRSKCSCYYLPQGSYSVCVYVCVLRGEFGGRETGIQKDEGYCEEEVQSFSLEVTTGQEGSKHVFGPHLQQPEHNRSTDKFHAEWEWRLSKGITRRPEAFQEKTNWTKS